jgi:copper chaperone CopZ
MHHVNIAIEGMHCQACVARVRRALEKLDGVTIHEISVGSASVDTADPAAALAAISSAGYPAQQAG